MSGFTKHQSRKFIEDSNKQFTKYIGEILNILPKQYQFRTIVTLLNKYYPFEIQLFIETCEYYKLKDRILVSKDKKIRHKLPDYNFILKGLNITKKILSENFKDKFSSSFSIDQNKKNIKYLNDKRFPKINKINEKIDIAKKKTQLVEPSYLDALIGLYDRKTTIQKDKVYIFKELEKYYCSKTVMFFKKKVDTEYNRQLREMAFYHMQSYMHFVTLRKQKYMRIPSKNKKRRKYLTKIYACEKFSITSIPEELEYRINNSKEQKLKEFDFFISHSSLDFNEVQDLIRVFNKDNKNIYCDWINDTDYLKRRLVCNATKIIIEKRLEQSKFVILVKSKDSLNSKWVKYELNYFDSLKKIIYEIDIDELRKGNFAYKKSMDKWFIDDDFKNIDLLK